MPEDCRGALSRASELKPNKPPIIAASVLASDFSRIREMHARVGDRIDHVRLSRVTPLAAPLFLEPGRVPVRGLATSAAEAFRTPLGDVPLDQDTISALPLQVSDDAHRDEHSLEVHLPFLQRVLGSFDLVPIVVGDASQQAVADMLGQLWGGPETLLVISSDLSHYLDYAAAQARDRATRDAIERFDAGAIGHGDACGATPVGGLLLAAQRHGLDVTTLDLRTSGDTAGDKQRVVGYGAWLFAEKKTRRTAYREKSDSTPSNGLT